MTHPKTVTSPLLAIAICTLGIFLLSAMDAAVKGLVIVIGAYNTLLWRSLFATAMAGAAWISTSPPLPGASVLRLHVLRGVTISLAALTYFFGLGRLPLAEAIALSFIAPLIALLLAALLLGERIGRSAIWASLIGMSGVLVIMLGNFSGVGHQPGAALGMAAIIVSAVLYAYNLILARRQALAARPLEIVFFQNLVVGLSMGLAAPWLGVALPQELWLPLLGVAVLVVCGHISMSWAYARAEAQHLIPTEYSAFVWAALLGWVFFEEPLSWTTLTGAALIVGGCMVASRARPRLAKRAESAAI